MRNTRKPFGGGRRAAGTPLGGPGGRGGRRCQGRELMRRDRRDSAGMLRYSSCTAAGRLAGWQLCPVALHPSATPKSTVQYCNFRANSSAAWSERLVREDALRVSLFMTGFWSEAFERCRIACIPCTVAALFCRHSWSCWGLPYRSCLAFGWASAWLFLHNILVVCLMSSLYCMPWHFCGCG